MQCPFGTNRSRRYIPWLSIAIPALGWLVFGLYPSFATVFYSFTQYSGLPGTALNLCGLCNYHRAFTILLPQLGGSILISVIFTAAVTIIQTGIALGLALLLRRRGWQFGFFRALIFMPAVLSVVVVASTFKLIFDPVSGPAQQILHSLTGSGSAFLGSYNAALPIVIGITVWMGTGYAMVIFIAGLRRVPEECYEAAQLAGAGKWRMFRYITWPLLAPATTVNVFLCAMSQLGEYALILVLTDGNFNTNTIGVYMFNTAFGGANSVAELGYGSMLAVIQFLLTLVIGGGLLYGLRRREVSL